MKLFSTRYGYTKPNDVIVRERITAEIQNAICNCFEIFEKEICHDSRMRGDEYKQMEKMLWTHFLNMRLSEFENYGKYKVVLTEYVQSQSFDWYMKLDIVEFAIKYLYVASESNRVFFSLLEDLIKGLNYELDRLNFAYRIIDKCVVEITSKDEMDAIEKALADNKDNIRMHLSKALEICAKRPVGDYRNSIKESISAVEALCRKKTGEDTLGKALNKLEKNGVVIPKLLKVAFDKLYAYTNQIQAYVMH